jgi:hypothetical protein
MSKKTVLTFILALGLFFLLLQSFFKFMISAQDKKDAVQMAIIQENVKDRFKLFLDLPLSMCIVGADYLAQDIYNKNYGPLFDKILDINKDIIGLNLVDTKGKIIKVMPAESNPHTEGRTTQNIKSLKQSMERGDDFWLSSPFKLYQGQQGFVIYVPIKNGSIKGWLASVISTEKFFEMFKLKEFLESYDLIIKDQETGRPYFATGISPDSDIKIYESFTTLHGRHLIFESWRKQSSMAQIFSWYYSLLIAFILALAAAFMMKLFEQRRNARLQLEDISTLLRLTGKEAINNLIELQAEEELKTFDTTTYLTNLIEQIDLLQTMAYTGNRPNFEKCELLPLIQNQLEHLEGIVLKKNLHLRLKEQLNNVSVMANCSLLQNSVLSNILGHAIIYAQPGSDIEISYKSSEDQQFITFHIFKMISKTSDTKPSSLNRRIEVAKKVLNIFEGDLYVQNDLLEGMILRMVLPI